MPNYNYIEKFKNAVKECKITAENEFQIELPASVRFDVSKCIVKNKYDISNYLADRFIKIGHNNGTYVSRTPACRIFWNNGMPPKLFLFRVCRIQWGNAVIEIDINNELCKRGEYPEFEVYKNYDPNEGLNVIDN